MSAQPIPATWRQEVVAHLRARGNRIEYTNDFRTHWQRDFPRGTYRELLEDFEAMLVQPLQGCPVHLTPPAREGETWEFWFMHQNDKAYGKILLRKDGNGIVLYSAHRPEFKYLKCERPYAL